MLLTIASPGKLSPVNRRFDFSCGGETSKLA
jgi:hypothetical protein